MSKTHILFSAHSLKKRPKLWREVEEYIQRHQLDWRMVPSERDGLKNQAQNALDEGAALIAVVGGDGSVHEIAGVLAGSGCALGVLPGGTGNDFCRAAGIPKKFSRALDLLRTGENRPIDLGRCNGEVFINVAGAGFDALVVKNAQPYKQRGMGGSLAYLRSVFYTLRHMDAYPMKSAKGLQDEWPTVMLMVAAGNGHYIGGGMKVTPLAKLDDGLLDICLVGKVGLARFLLLFPAFLAGKHIRFPSTIHYEKTKRLRIDFDRTLPIQLDGELREGKHFYIEVLPQALKLRVPRQGQE